MSILLMAVTSFYGLWTGLDFLFKETDTTPDMIATNGAICSVRISAIAHALISKLFVYIRDRTGATEFQIVRTPLRVFYDCVGKPDWIVFSLKSPIDFTVF